MTRERSRSRQGLKAEKSFESLGRGPTVVPARGIAGAFRGDRREVIELRKNLVHHLGELAARRIDDREFAVE